MLSSGGHPTPPDKRGANLLACNFQKVAGGLSQRTFQNNNHSFVFSGNACSCSHCKKKVNIQGVVTPNDPGIPATAGVVVTPLENGRYFCESSECKTKEVKRLFDKDNSWQTAVTAAYHMLRETRCDHCFLLAPLTEVHRSKCRTKNYCSQLCKDSDDAVHKVCSNPDKKL